jgi:multicomponent Na+:H+ antiporter subunit E
VIARAVALLIIWVALWGELSVANVASGILLAGVLAALFPAPPAPPAALRHRVHPLALVTLGWHLLVSLVTSSWTVVRTVIAPQPGSRDADVVAVPLATRSPLVASIVANAITLTPGTMSVACSTSTFVLEIHVLGRHEYSEFVDAVGLLEQRVTAAVTPREGGQR